MPASASQSLPSMIPGPEVRLAVARARWLEIQDELLRGITHALSNRIATISAAAYMLEFNDITAEQAAASLRSETERMDVLLQLLRQLPSRDDSGFEPVMPSELVSQAVELHAHHSDLRDVAVHIEVADSVLPVWVEPHSLLQALLLALTAAKRAAFPNALGVHVMLHGDAEVVRFSVHPENTSGSIDFTRTAIDAAAAECCLLAARGRATARTDGGCELELPTLPAVRRAGR